MSTDRITLLAIALLPFAAVTGCADSTGPGGASRTERFMWSGAVTQTATIEIKNTNGDVHARPGPDAFVRVTAVKKGTHDDPSSVRIEVLETAQGVTICAVYPDVPGHPANECRPGLAGQLASRYNDVSVDFEVQVPAGRAFLGATIGGSVDASGLTGYVSARTIGGDVRLSTTGLADASVINGDIDASIGRAVWDRDLSFQAIAGDVTVRLPLATNADVRGTTANGDVSTDFPLRITRVGASRQLQGRLGSGGRFLNIATTSGNIALRAQ